MSLFLSIPDASEPYRNELRQAAWRHRQHAALLNRFAAQYEHAADPELAKARDCRARASRYIREADAMESKIAHPHTTEIPP